MRDGSGTWRAARAGTELPLALVVQAVLLEIPDHLAVIIQMVFPVAVGVEAQQLQAVRAGVPLVRRGAQVVRTLEIRATPE